MNKRNIAKPLTIKEYTKNYKFPENNKVSFEDDYIHRTQNKFLSKILNKKIKIPDDENINKTIENVFHKEENRKIILSILKRRNHKALYTSDKLTISKKNTRDKSYDSLQDKIINGQKYSGCHTSIKKYKQINSFTKRNMTKAVTPLVNNRNKKNYITRESNKINKENNNSGFDINENKKLNQKHEIFFSSGHLKVESNKIKYDNNKINHNNLNKSEKNIISDGKYNQNLRNANKIRKKIYSLKIVKFEQIFLNKRDLIKNHFHNNYKQEKCAQITIKNQKDKNQEYSGYILLKKKFGKIEEEILLDEDEDKLKKVFINIMDDITGEENDVITNNELELLYLMKQENELNKQKLKEQEILIQDNKKLKDELDKLIMENNKYKEKIELLEAKEEEINKVNEEFKEYKELEIQNLEKQINLYENELNLIKSEKNRIKDYNVQKFEISIGNDKDIKSDDVKDNQNESDKVKEKNEKLSRALNRIKKKKNVEESDEKNTKNNIKKSNKIYQIVKMLEQQMKGKSNENGKENENNKELEIIKTGEKDFINLLEGKPLNINKRKKTINVKFKDES